MDLLSVFRKTALAEGVSYILLLGIGSTLKRLIGEERPLMVLGMLHGVLFIAFVILLLLVWQKYKWSFGKVALAFGLSLIPFGTFYLEKRLRTEEKATA